VAVAHIGYLPISRSVQNSVDIPLVKEPDICDSRHDKSAIAYWTI